MAERSKHLERVLRECAELSVPDTVVPWPAVRERVGAERAGGERAHEEDAAPGTRRRSWSPEFVPNTPLGLALAILSVLILGAGLYAVSGPARELVGNGPPDPGSPGLGAPGPGEKKDRGQADGLASGSGVAYRLFRGAVPGGGGEEVGQTKSADGARVTLEWAYADEEFVVVGVEARDLDGAREIKGYPGPVVLQPVLIGEEGGNEAELPPRVDLTDGSGDVFTNIDGMTQYPGAVAVFEAPQGLKAGREHRFRLEVPLQEGGMPGMPGERKPDAGPFVFDFEIPVRPVPVVEVDQKATAKGITLTLDRVVNSPSRPQAVVCIDPPDEEHTWTPWLERNDMPIDAATAPRPLGDGCWARTLGEPVEGPSSVTVAYIDGLPRDPADPDEDGKKIRGPWTFEFKAPG